MRRKNEKFSRKFNSQSTRKNAENLDYESVKNEGLALFQKGEILITYYVIIYMTSSSQI